MNASPAPALTPARPWPRARWVLAMAAAAVVLLGAFALDQAVLAWMGAHAGRPLKAVASFVSRAGDWPCLGLATALLWVLAFVRRWVRWQSILALMLASSMLAGLIVNPLRVATGRIRPDARAEAAWVGPVGPGRTKPVQRKYCSFPSAHTTVAFALATPVLFFGGRFAVLALGIATAVGLSRICLSAHYFSDVCAGALLGLGCGALFSFSPKAHLSVGKLVAFLNRSAPGEPAPPPVRVKV